MAQEQLTKFQEAAINFDTGNCLVSAGAGSGKTKVLTLRIVDLVRKKKAMLDQLLVLTFTNKAAYEIKDRVRRAIAESPDPEISRHAAEVEGASIMTFDAFALELVSRYRYALGIEREVALVPESMVELKRKQTLEAIVEERAALANQGKDPLFASVVGAYCLANVNPLIKLVSSIDKEGNLKKDKAAFLSSFVNECYSDSFFAAGIRECYEKARGKLQKAQDLCQGYSVMELGQSMSNLVAELLTYPDYASLSARFAAEISFPRYESKYDPIDKPRNKVVKDLISEAKAMVAGDVATEKAKWLETKDAAIVAFEIAAELDRRMTAWGKRYSAYSFADIASLARNLAQKPDVAAELKARYKYAMIDEYQDTSDLQDQLIDSLACDSVFAVGDIKQSIYRFRNANPKNFKSKMDAYQNPKNGTLITMGDNFRSREQIIDAVNLIFSRIMTEEVGGVDYSNNQALAFGNHGYDATANDEKYGYEFYRYESDKPQDEAEAEIVAKDILDRMKKGYRFHANEGKGPTYSDFAILISAKTSFPVYQKVFRKYGIPLEVTGSPKKEEKTIKTVLKNLLRLCEAVEKGIAPSSSLKHLYASIKRSFVFGEKDETIYKALKDDSYLKDPIFPQIRDILDHSDSLVLLTQNLISEFAIIEKIPLIGDMKENYETLEAWMNGLSFFARFGWGLSEAVAYFDDLADHKVESEEEKTASEKNAVQLMTIHASKGLEFPFVYLPSLTSRFVSEKTNMVFSRVYGPLFKNPKDTYQNPETVFFRLQKESETAESKSERMRLFYVALTRAKENLVFLLPKDSEEAFLPSLAHSFAEFLSLANAETGHQADKSALAEPSPIKPPKVDPANLSFHAVSRPAEEVAVERASKAIETPIDPALLRYGEKLHRLMELVDVARKDVSWIKEPKLREKIEETLRLPIFANVEKAKQYHEYSFLGKDGQEGKIDLFLLYEDHIDLIDFKASNIDDPAYQKQLAFYADFLKESFKLPVHSYLISISQARELRVE